MRAMVLEAARQPLRAVQMPVPEPGSEQVLIRVRACGVCRTDLHVLDGDLRGPKLPVILGHEIVGVIVGMGAEVRRFAVGERVGVPWLAWTDGSCRYCRRGQENLCDKALFTGYTVDGGYAEYALAHENYCFPLPKGYADAELAPLLCAGLIGYRAYRMAGENAEHIGIYGFGAAAHIIAQVAVHQGKRVYAFTRPGDVEGQAFARRLGAVWAGESGERPPEALHAALIFAPAGTLIVDALRATCKGGVIVCGGIHMSDIPAFPYRLLWEERVIRSVANLTRQDAEELLSIAPEIPIKTRVQTFALEEADEALRRLREGAIEGAAVLVMAQTDD
ncbi:MAG: zinc-dependent alcohol dehydrogenase family protein [Gammaproteobacteria bacterium]